MIDISEMSIDISEMSINEILLHFVTILLIKRCFLDRAIMSIG